MHFVYINILYILIFFSIYIEINGKTIKILLEKPSIIEAQYSKEDFSLINEKFSSLNINDTLLHDINIEFSYYNKGFNNNTNNYSENYIKYVVEQFKDPKATYDIMILDDRFLFSDVSKIESGLILSEFNFRKLHQYFVNILDYINIEDYHEYWNDFDPKILKDGFLNEKLYGLPYELDFDVIYYNEKEEISEIINSLENITWDDLLLLINSPTNYSIKSPFSIPLGNNDELLNFFVEYISNKYDLSEETIKKDSKYYEVFYREESKPIFNSFRNFVKNCSKSDTEKMINIDREEAFQNFIDQKSIFYKGRMSFYDMLFSNQNKTILYVPPPKHFSVINEKYLILNTKSNIEKKILVKAAMQLTSKEMQLFKAEKFGSIPALKITKKDEAIEKYCQDHKELCETIKEIKPIRIKNIFKVNNYSVPFLEIRLRIPKNIKNFLMDNDFKNLSEIFYKNIDIYLKFIKSETNVPKIIYNSFLVIFILYSITTILMIYKYRKHPYIKIISPLLLCVIVIGIVLNTISHLLIFIINSTFKCKIQYGSYTFSIYMIRLPMLFISYRMYYILKNNSKVNF
eukprot:jgi/Orpsp1_1/1188704/evm.model.d7180000066596.1